jgi:acyl-CoA thioester hydrolase
MTDTPYSIDLEVRDYECDLQGIVNNSVYQNYLEHARHCFLRASGIDFAEITARGIHLVVIKAELDYKQSLKPGDRFRVTVRMEKAGRIRWAFVQEIRRIPDDTLMVAGRITGASLNERGRPSLVPELEPLLQEQPTGQHQNPQS